jgi:predicted GNAT superfamily acetyltransferase
LNLPQYFQAGAELLNPTNIMENGLPYPPSIKQPYSRIEDQQEQTAMFLVEIPADFQSLKAMDLPLGLEWRIQTRGLFESLFANGYLVTDFVFLPGAHPRSFYVLSHGERTLGA